MDHVGEGRSAFASDSWAETCRHLERADADQPLSLDDLERLAVATYLVGREEDSTRVWARAFHMARDAGDPKRAVRSAFWVAFVLLNRGDLAGGNGWTARARRLLSDEAEEIEAAGRVAYLEALHAVFTGDADTAKEAFARAIEAGDSCGDTDLATLARLGLGRALIRLVRHDKGLSFLDEAMVAVREREVSPLVVGDSYCTAIDGCRETFDLRRARRWTEELSAWCDRHVDLVAFRGLCLLHRAEILQLGGEWPAALDEARHAEEYVGRPSGHLARGAACYQRGELHRLRGEFDDARDAYEQARQHGRDPQPGLALLWLAEDRLEASVAAIQRKLTEARSAISRSRLLPASVEVFLADGESEAAREVCDELGEIARAFNSRLLQAHGAYCEGAVDLADGKLELALGALRHALEEWQDLDVPYEAARTRVLIARACRQLGDHDTATSEVEAARMTFLQLGAAADIASLDKPADDRDPLEPKAEEFGLTGRELEVLRHLASGRTNRAIAEELFISERTVDRHVSNILTKLRVSSRTAATAYAYDHDLV